MRRLLLVAALLIAALPAHAMQLLGVLGSGGAALYTGPQDAVSQAPQLYYSSTYAVSGSYAASGGLSFNVVRASDSHTCDIPFVATGGASGNTKNCSTGGDNGQTLASFLTSTTGNFTEEYEEMGTGANLTQSTSSLQPNVVLSGVGALPVLHNPGTNHGGQGLAAGGTNLFVTPVQPFSMAVIFNRDVASTNDYEASFIIGDGQLGVVQSGGPNFLVFTNFYAGDGVDLVASEGAYHSFVGTANLGSSFALLDGREAAGVFTNPSYSNDYISLGGWQGPNATYLGYIPEMILWPNPGLSLAQTQLLCINDQNRYPLQKSCAQASGTYVGLGDAVSSAIAGTANGFFSCGQAYNGGYADGAHAGCNLRRLSDSHTCDFLLTTAGGMGNSVNCSSSGDNAQSFATWTTSTSAVFTEGYDQTFNGNNVPQPTTGAQPLVVANCLNGLPCIETDGSSTYINLPQVFVPWQPQTIVMAARSDTAPGGFSTFYSNYGSGNGPWLTAASPTQWNINFNGGSANFNVTAAVATVHASVLAMPAAGPLTLNVDGTENSGAQTTSGSNISAIPLGLGAAPNGGFYFAIKVGEIGDWINGMGTSDRAAACHNEGTRFGATITC
jgi:hypothetical protein